MNNDRIWILIARKLAGEATPEEIKELEQLVNDNPALGFQLQVLTDCWQSEGTNLSNEETDQAFNRIRARLQQKTGMPSRPTLQAWPEQMEYRRHRGGMAQRLREGCRILTSYLKFAWRLLFHNKAFSFVNITGLATGMACAVIILLAVAFELSIDQFHQKKDSIYLVYNKAFTDGRTQCWPITPMVMGPVLKTQYREVEEVARMNWVAAFILKAGDKQVQTEGFLTDPGFLTMFDFPLKKGDAKTALSAEHAIVITESLEKKMFNGEDAMGKTIKIDSNAIFTVTGVMKDPPDNTRFGFEYLVPWSYMKEVGWDRTDWGENSIVHTYVQLKAGVSERAANARFRDIIRTHDKDVKNEVFLHPMRKWYLWSRFENGKIAGGHIEQVRMFSIIAGVILLIACINYMNLTTARSIKRAREVGIRKVTGAGRRSLVGQFLTESVLLALLAAALALIILGPALEWFNHHFETRLAIPFETPRFWLYALAFILFTGILAGSYPAFYLSAYKPIRVLKGLFKGSNALIAPRKVLVVVQFTFAITLIICTIVIYRQFAFGRERDTGYDQDGLAFVYIKGNAREKYPLIREELISSSAITGITRTNSPITDVWAWDETYTWEGKEEGSRHKFMKYIAAHGFVQTMGLKLLSGRDIDVHRYPSDSAAVLINETAARTLGFKDPVGQVMKSPRGDRYIVGVINNFLGWPYQRLFPVIIEGPGNNDKNWAGTISFRLNKRYSESANLKKIEAIFKKHNPDYPFEHHFVKEAYARQFSGIKSFGALSTLFAGLAIFISCLGLFALSVCMAENRIKEIGVRKVLGASALRLTTLLSGGFLKLVIVSFIIASPLAWWLMNAWLSDFSYRVVITWWVFALTGVISVLIAIVTVSFQAVKAAMASPVKSLRTE